ncbi:hypothetical protein F4821DRAFT_276212 [Hypoxylon rubiginosum]|uniref:Uncharacterized protein n=1 Tax=Hypoxylon rubiginosum TaxID=110542 RepID=A0ACC0CJ26_9PEZI|nr:hypothetical protein F4821DRAFT_276212 [Hypoxylon rubiginosum]
MSSSSTQTAVCTVCFEPKRLAEFPGTRLSTSCTHEPSTCLECLTLYINSRISETAAGLMRCPECEEQLDFETIHLLARRDLFDQFQRQSIDDLISKVPRFVWCPLGCGTGQVHPSGADQPLVFCLRCNRHFCFRHRTIWHTNYTCDEYDAFLADPQNFRSRAQMQSAVDADRDAAERRYRQQLAEAEARFTQSLLREEEAAEARRIAEEQRRLEERRQAEERARREEEEKRAREALELQARLRNEEQQTRNVFRRLTKPCPGCRVPIEKNQGCCGTDFSWNGAHW